MAKHGKGESSVLLLVNMTSFPDYKSSRKPVFQGEARIVHRCPR